MFEKWRKIFYSFAEDTAVEEIYQVSKEMMSMAHGMLEHSIESLRYKDLIKEDKDIYGLDKELNNMEADIRRKLFMYLTVDRPVKNHHAVLVMSLISHDIERIGDYSKNIFDLAKRYDSSQSFGTYDASLKQIEHLILSEFKTLNQCLQEFDENVHKSIGEGLTSANENIETILRELQDTPEKSKLETKNLISLVLYLRFLKRTSSHLRNISSSYYNPIDRIGFRVNQSDSL